MEHSSPVSKIVATATTTSWAQAYSAGKLHLALSLEGEMEGSVTSLGKDILEKIQREFFALDEKNLEALKKVVETVAKTIPPETILSLVLTTIVERVLYIIIFNSGSVLLKRGGNIAVIGNGEKDEAVGFSGRLETDDTVLTATSGFLKTVSYDNLEKALKNDSPHEISESLAPFLHENALGTEAALVWKMIETKKTPIEEDLQDQEHPNDILVLNEEPKKEKVSFYISNIISFLKNSPLKNFSFKKINISNLRFNRRQLIIGAAALLVIILSFSLFFETVSRKNSKDAAEATSFLTPAKQKYDDAVALMSLDKSLAIENLQQLKTDTEKEKSKFPGNSSTSNQINSFLAQVNQALGGQTNLSSSKINVFFDASKNSELSNVSAITDKGGQITIAGKTKGGFLKSDGSIDSTFDSGGVVIGITQDDKNVYLLEDTSVLQVARSGGKPSAIIDKQINPVSIDTFGGNIYLLSGTDKTIYKYRPTAYDKEPYFTTSTTIGYASSISIDSSVYVAADGKILKFTRGAADTFSYAGKPLSPTAQIYTDVDYTNLYVLDPEKKTATVLSKTGSIITEISLKGMKDITSIAADEANKKIYISADNKIYSISF